MTMNDTKKNHEPKKVSATEIAMRTNELEKSNPRITLDLMKALTEKEDIPKSQYEKDSQRLAWQSLNMPNSKTREQALLELQVLTRKHLQEGEEE